MFNLYKEKDSVFYYIVKEGYGAYFPHATTESQQRDAIKSALSEVNACKAGRRKRGLEVVTKNQDCFEYLGEMECVSDVLATIQLLEN